jgi:hypothetical protein
MVEGVFTFIWIRRVDAPSTLTLTLTVRLAREGSDRE